MLTRGLCRAGWGLTRRGTRTEARRCQHTHQGRTEALFALLGERDLLADCTDREGLRAALDADGLAPCSAYIGIDPTAPSLHTGHLAGLRVMRHLQEAGIEPIILVGGVTALIGDPSGRTAERVALDLDVVKNNAASIDTMVRSILAADNNDDDSLDSLPAVRVLDNAAWLGGLTVVELLSGGGRHARMSTMLSKENVRSRLQQGSGGMSFAEFTYPLLQAQDWVHLFERYNCVLQVGGADQWGNITVGTDTVKRSLERGLADTKKPATGDREGAPPALVPIGLTYRLLTDAGGNKLGKSAGNAVWLDKTMTSPYAFFQFFRRLDCETAALLARQLTDLPLAEISELGRQQDLDPGAAALSTRLGEAVTEWVHGPAELQAAKSASKVLYGGDVQGVSAHVLRDVLCEGGANVERVPRDEVVGMRLVELCARGGLTSSLGEARRLLKAGGLYMNSVRVTPSGTGEVLVLDEDLIDGEVVLLRAGKKKHALIDVTK